MDELIRATAVCCPPGITNDIIHEAPVDVLHTAKMAQKTQGCFGTKAPRRHHQDWSSYTLRRIHLVLDVVLFVDPIVHADPKEPVAR